MILEVAILDVKPEEAVEFENAFSDSQQLISSVPGYVSHQLQKCIERPSRYILLVNWKTLEAHTEGFRGSSQYQAWKAALHRFYDPFPEVEHYNTLFTSGI